MVCFFFIGRVIIFFISLVFVFSGVVFFFFFGDKQGVVELFLLVEFYRGVVVGGWIFN